jgi:GNAT superfamily N-acetyltransferase
VTLLFAAGPRSKARARPVVTSHLPIPARCGTFREWYALPPARANPEAGDIAVTPNEPSRSITLRDARSEDVRALDAFATPTRLPGDQQGVAARDSRTHDEGVLRVAVTDDDRVVGAQHYQHLDSTQCWLSGIRVHPEFRRHGIAGMLLADAVRMAQSERLLTLRYSGDAMNEAVHRLSQAHRARPRGTWVSFERTMDASACELGRAKPSLGQAATALGQGDRLRALSLVHASGRSLYAEGWVWRTLDAAAIASLIQGGHAFLARSGVGGWSLALLATHPESEMEATLYGTDPVCAQAVLDHLKRSACAAADGVDIIVHVPQDSPASGLLGSLARRGEWRPVTEHALRVWEIELTPKAS